ncbi:MAG: hypothetical protein O2805_02080 [Proteobacteria bacterium]|nr:hypothetical protein [Pseudomonadota bacterium]
MGARQLPKSTVHRFATFRRMLQQFAEQNTRVFILVEDATRIGPDTLSELEALTAADAGVSNGANLILLGDDSINDLLRDPKLARLKQRLRTRQKLDAQNVIELQGYLKHCFRLAGREFDTIFAEGSANTLHDLSDGLPRVVNNLLESVLNIAAEKGDKRITPQMIAQTAAEEFGLTTKHKVEHVAAAIEKAAAVEDILPPEPALANATPVVRVEEDDMPVFIQDTLPDLEILAPYLARGPEQFAASWQARPVPLKVSTTVIEEPVHEQTENELPVLTNLTANIPSEARDEDGRIPKDIPAWDRDPTFAELRPDLEALERAMAIAQGPDAVAAASQLRPRRGTSKSADNDDRVEVIPEITLDKQIEAKIQEETEALKKTQPEPAAAPRSGSNASNDDQSGGVKSVKATIQPVVKAVPKTEQKPVPKAIPKPEPQIVPKPIAKPLTNTAPTPVPKVAAKPAEKPLPVVNKPAAAPIARVAATAPTVAAAAVATTAPAKEARLPVQELEKIASSIAMARTIEDVDDFMAETLFGEEFSSLAAQVAANASLPLDDEVQDVELSIEADKSNAPKVMDTSPSQRLKVLRELNNSTVPRGAPATPDATECIVMSGSRLESPTAANSVPVDSIEDQITTSMTQTLKALSIRPNAISEDDDDDDDDDSDKGFFSRFRRK